VKLDRTTFEEKYKSGELHIAFIGMSNIGKSYTAMRLATDFDFRLIEVDKLIWEVLGHNDMEAFAAWQGQPYSKGYQTREQESIRLETSATQQALKTQAGNHILDTTGSVIYTGQETLKKLSETHYVVYIEASDTALERLKIQYFKQPKPLIWKGHFKKNLGQTNEEAIIASYPALLSSRAKTYKSLADATLSSEFILNADVNAKDVFESLKPAV
jgi:shikimate kinase